MYPEHEAPAWFRPAYSGEIETEYYNSDVQYAPDTVFYYDMYGPFQDLVSVHLAQGFRVIYDAKNEHYLNPIRAWLVDAFRQHPGQGMFLISGHTPQHIPGVTIAATPYWYWIMDYDNFVSWNYHRRPREPRHEHKFFMQLSLQREDRDRLYQLLEPVLPQSLHSYRSQGRFLYGDVDPNQVANWQRYINWDWINSCSITLVVESCLDDHLITGHSITEVNNRFICEKTYKPLAYGHAFLLASTHQNLAHVREQGFETFPELWDESYDDLHHYTERVTAIREIIREFDPASLDQPRVQQKIEHNQNRFFDSALCAALKQRTIVEPVMKFIYG